MDRYNKLAGSKHWCTSVSGMLTKPVLAANHACAMAIFD